MRRRTSFLATLAAAAIVIAAPTPTALADDKAAPVSIRYQGNLYEDLEFISTTGDGVTFETKQGPLMAVWLNLPEAIRQRFAKDYAASLQEQQTAVMKDFGMARIVGRVLQRLPHGIISTWLGQPVMLTGYPNESALTKGQQIDVTAQRTGSFPYTDDSGKTKIIRRFKVLVAR